MLKAIILNPKVIYRNNNPEDIENFLSFCDQTGLSVFLFSTHGYDKDRQLEQSLVNRGINAHLVTKSVVGKLKGSTKWIEYLTNQWGIKHHEVVYVGVSDLDWRTAINSATLYFHALWAEEKEPQVYFKCNSLNEVSLKIRFYLLHSHPLWAYKLDLSSEKLQFRCLLNAGQTSLKASKDKFFNLEDIFTYEQQILINDKISARSLLMTLLLTQLWIEGLIPKNPYFVVYPSSTPQKTNEIMGEYIKPASALFHGFYKENLLYRWKPTTDKSMARSRGEAHLISFEQEFNTLALDSRINLSNRTVIVIDDFSTTGMSLECARHLIYQAGAKKVITCAIGKFARTRHLHHLYKISKDFDPFIKSEKIQRGDFSHQEIPLDFDWEKQVKIVSLINSLVEG